jgi:hypothetical protein
LKVVFRRFELRFEFKWPWWPEVGSRISDSFGYLQRSLQGLFEFVGFRGSDTGLELASVW